MASHAATDERQGKVWSKVALISGAFVVSLFPALIFTRHVLKTPKTLKPAPVRLQRRAATPNITTRLEPAAPSQPIPTLSTDAVDDNFSPAWLAFKALGLATLAVSVGAGLSVWATLNLMNINTAAEFGEKMRSMLRSRIPSPSVGSETTRDETEWAERDKRLETVYAEGGVKAWSDAVWHEIEKEIALVETAEQSSKSSPSEPG